MGREGAGRADRRRGAAGGHFEVEVAACLPAFPAGVRSAGRGTTTVALERNSARASLAAAASGAHFDQPGKLPK